MIALKYTGWMEQSLPSRFKGDVEHRLVDGFLPARAFPETKGDFHTKYVLEFIIKDEENPLLATGSNTPWNCLFSVLGKLWVHIIKQKSSVKLRVVILWYTRFIFYKNHVYKAVEA